MSIQNNKSQISISKLKDKSKTLLVDYVLMPSHKEENLACMVVMVLEEIRWELIPSPEYFSFYLPTKLFKC